VGFQPGDAAALAEAIREALGWSPEERARRGEANRGFADARLGIGAWTEGLLAIYEGILG
jgi:trehalose-6-phosphate synthase